VRGIASQGAAVAAAVARVHLPLFWLQRVPRDGPGVPRRDRRRALYADLRHFGRKPIQLAWFLVAFPALLLNYLGQGGLLLGGPGERRGPVLPAGAAIRCIRSWHCRVASCIFAALIAAVLDHDAGDQLGYLPRMEVQHTLPDERSDLSAARQLVLAVGCIGVCLGFGSSSALANAYGMAVTLTMLITTALFYFATRRVFGWSAWRSVVLCTAFGLLELVFFGANLAKIAHGGWFRCSSRSHAAICTWKAGRRVLYEAIPHALSPLDSFLEIRHQPPLRVPGTAVYMAGAVRARRWLCCTISSTTRSCTSGVLLLTVVISEDPHVPEDQRVRYEEDAARLSPHDCQMRVRPCPPSCWKEMDVEVRISDTTFF
jgi:KUP system potassium uptake protein